MTDKTLPFSVLDLAPTLQALGSSAYLRSDTHWSEAGAQAAALALAPQIGALGATPTPATRPSRERLTSVRPSIFADSASSSAVEPVKRRRSIFCIPVTTTPSRS